MTLKKDLLIRLILFVLIFVVISGVSGSWLISTNRLLFPFYFSIYGGAGKAILLFVVSFLIMARQKLFSIPLSKFSKVNVLFGLGSAISLCLFFFFAVKLLSFSHFSQAPFLSLITHTMLWISGVCAVLAVFGMQYLKNVAKECKKPLLICLSISIVFYFAFAYIFKLWPYLSAIVLWAVSRLLILTISPVYVIKPLTIQLPTFAITIGEYCSGIESLFLISVLYLLIGSVEWMRLRKDRYILYFCPLLLGMFLLNIIRVYGIILAGIWISPDIAAKLFHTYLGMVLFIGYFLVFLKYAMPSLIKRSSLGGERI